MSVAALLIAHGSRRPEANDDLVQLAGIIRAKGVYPIVEIAYLELAQPDIPAGGRRCVELGATEVRLLPFFLSAGAHVVEDLKRHRRELEAEFPQVHFVLCPPLGLHPLIIDIVLDRLASTPPSGTASAPLSGVASAPLSGVASAPLSGVASAPLSGVASAPRVESSHEATPRDPCRDQLVALTRPRSGQHVFWLLTSTFYGNWLPGDPRGFVSRVRDVRPEEQHPPTRHKHNQPETPYDEAMPGLQRSAAAKLRGPPIRITQSQAEILLAQFQETARYRGWKLLAVAVMSNHVHLVVAADDCWDATKLLGDFKAYGSRALNRRCPKPPSGTWWTYDGSKRRLGTSQAVLNAVEYVRAQPGALVVWISPELNVPL